MPFPAAHISFSGGELSPEVRARIDVSKYQVGLATMRNFWSRVAGGADNRPGLEFVYEVEDSSEAARLLPFAFNVEQTYALVFQPLSMRVVKDGGIILEGGVTITDATQTDPVNVEATAHGYTTGDQVFIEGVGGMIELNERFFIVTVVDADNVTLDDTDGTGFGAFTSGGTISRVFTLTTPYLESELFELAYTQSNDVMTLVHSDQDPSDLNRVTETNWTLDVITIAPEIAAPTGVVSAYTGAGTGIDYDYVVTAINEDTGEESVASTKTSEANKDLGNAAGDKIVVDWNTVTDATQYNIYKALDGSEFYGFIGSSNTLTFTDRNITQEFNESPALSIKDPFSGTDNKPSTVAYFQGRRWFAATNNLPVTAFGSVSGNFTNFNVSKAVRDDDSIEVTLSSAQANAIRHLTPLGQLVVFTAGSEWLLSSSSTSSLITPSSASFAVQGYWGATRLKPIVVGSSALYVVGNFEETQGAKFSRVRDIQYGLETDNYSGSELSILARHLFDGFEIIDWTYAQIPHSQVWAIRDDGIALCMTYVQEHQMWAWSRHDTNGSFESVTSVREGGEDVVYFVVRRELQGTFKRFVERMHSRQFASIEDWFGVDSGVSLDDPKDITGATQTDPVSMLVMAHGYSNGDKVDIVDVRGMTQLNGNRYQVSNATTNAFDLQTDEASPVDVDGTGFSLYDKGGVTRQAKDSVVGLDHLEGETIVALADGNVLVDLLVTDGAIELGGFYSRVHAGLPYTSDLETLDANVIDARGTMFGAKRKADGVMLRLDRSRGGQVGSSEDTLFEMKWREDEGFGEPGALSSEDIFVTVESEWSFAAPVFFRQSDPLPTTILSAIPDLERADG